MDESKHVAFSRSLLLAAAAAAGLVQMGVFMSDLPEGASIAPRIAASIAIAVVSGVLAGWLRPGSWFAISTVSVWGAIVSGATLGLLRAERALPVLVIPPLAAWLGGFLGKTLKGWAERPRGGS